MSGYITVKVEAERIGLMHRVRRLLRLRAWAGTFGWKGALWLTLCAVMGMRVTVQSR